MLTIPLQVFFLFHYVKLSGMFPASCLQPKYIHMLPQPGMGLAGNSKLVF